MKKFVHIKSCVTFPSEGTSEIAEQSPEHAISWEAVISYSGSLCCSPGNIPRHEASRTLLLRGAPPTRGPGQEHTMERWTRARQPADEQQEHNAKHHVEELEYSDLGFCLKKKIPLGWGTFSNQLLFLVYLSKIAIAHSNLFCVHNKN